MESQRQRSLAGKAPDSSPQNPGKGGPVPQGPVSPSPLILRPGGWKPSWSSDTDLTLQTIPKNMVVLHVPSPSTTNSAVNEALPGTEFLMDGLIAKALDDSRFRFSPSRTSWLERPLY